jgi:AAHS family 4-hydroxybenzoate transporter-like MFS transporter
MTAGLGNSMNEQTRDTDVGELLENRRLGPFQAFTLALCFLILFVDGLDYSAANVGAPAILRAFNAERTAMGTVFGWGYFGIFIGSVVFGIVGDRYGRKRGAVLGVLAYSLPALLTPTAGSLDEVTIFRFLAGIGIGGVIPNTIALLTETAPKRFRVSAVMAGFVGYSLGNAVSGQVAAWLTPDFGWSIVFVVAGVSGTGLGVVLVWALPESIPFLAATKPDAPQLRRLVVCAAPELTINSATRFVLRRPANETTFSLGLLFNGYRRIATLLLWIAFFAESLTYMTLSAWFAVILETAGLPPTQAALVFSYAAVGGIFAILLFGPLIDRFGPRAAVLSAVIAVTAIIYLGTPGLSAALITAVAIAAIAFAAATHQSLNGIVGGFYPTIIRGNGVGYATGMGRIAAIIGPIIVGWLFAAKLPLQDVIVFIAAPDLVVAAVCIDLDRLRRSKLMIEDFRPAVSAGKQLA